MNTYHVVTYGCQMNLHDSEHIAGILERTGLVKSDEAESSDVVVFNTCCVRGSAENRLWGALGHVSSWNDPRVVVVTGCSAQLHGTNILSDFPGVNLVIGRDKIETLPELIERSERQRLCAVGDPSGGPIDFMNRVPLLPSRGWVEISHGCSNFCSYCIVPFVRGRERCRSLGSVVEEVERLVRVDGVKEIFLLGQNVNSYKDARNPEWGFAEALRRISSIEGVHRVKFLTSNPKDLGDDIIDAFAGLSQVCGFLHLPLQAGSDRILESMNRGYDSDHFLEIVEKLRSSMPDLVLTTDIMVGFPGETGQEFSDTVSMLERVRFDGAYTFMYCDRPGTRASDLGEKIGEEEKKRRLEKVARLQSEITHEKNMELVGRTVEVLVEGPAKRGEGLLTGRDRGNRVVNFPGSEELVGELQIVTITGSGKNSLRGTLEPRAVLAAMP